MIMVGATWGFLGAADAATDISRIVTSAAIAIALVAGIFKCVTISRRETTHTQCVLALMFFLLGWLVVQVASTVHRLTGGLYMAITASIGLLALSCFLLAIILAIVGLIDYGRQKDRFTQGRGQAIWALVMSVLLGGAFFSAAVIAAIKSAGGAGLRAGGRDKAGEVTRLEEFNLQITHPGRPWITWTDPAQRVNEDARYGLRQLRPEVYYIIIPERPGEGMFEDSQEVVEIAQLNMKTAATSARFEPVTPAVYNGLAGLQFDAEARVANRDIFYRIWICYTNGYSYQCLTWGQLKHRKEVAGAADRINRGLRPIDPDRIAPSGRGGQLTDFDSPHFHYRVAYSNANWFAWPTVRSDLPEAETAALGPRDSALAVMPVWLDGLDAPQRPLAQGLFGGMGMDLSDEALQERRPIDRGAVKGIEYDYEQSIEDTIYAYRFQVLSGGGYGYLLGVWAPKERDGLDAFFSEALDRVQFTAPPEDDAGPESPGDWLHTTQALVLNRIGLSYYRDSLTEKAAPFFKAATQWDSADSTYLDNLMEFWMEQENFREALSYLDERREDSLPSFKLLARRAALLFRLEDPDAALKQYASLFSEGFEDADHFSIYIQLLLDADRTDEAQERVQTYLKRRDTFAIRLLEARVHLARKDYDTAIPLLKAQRERAPANPDVAFALVEAFQEAELHKEARELLESIIADGTDSAYAWYLKANSELNLKWYREAKESLEAAVKRAPANSDIKGTLDYVSSILGESSTDAIKARIAPVSVPRELMVPPEEDKPPAGAREHGAYYVKSITAVSYTPGKSQRETRVQLIRVLDAAGVSRFSSLQFGYDPVLQSVHVNHLTVTDAEGNVVSEGDPDRYYILDDTSGQMVTQAKNLHLPVAGLQPGCLISLMVTTEHLGRSEAFHYLDESFSRAIPTQESIVYVEGDVGRLRQAAYPTPRDPTRLGTNALYWKVSAPLVYRWEPLQQDAATFLPGIRVADGGAGWQQLATNYLQDIKERLQAHSPLELLTRDLLKGAEGRQARLERISQFVQTNLNYQAIEFGTRGRMPQSVGDILDNRYGDCKDHSLLLLHMLRSADVPAHLALVNSSAPIEEALPALDQFDHMILYVPPDKDGGQAWFLDATDKGCDLTRVLPLGLAGGRFGNGSFEVVLKERAAEWKGHIERISGRFPSTDYAPCRQALKELVDFAQARLVFAPVAETSVSGATDGAAP